MKLSVVKQIFRICICAVFILLPAMAFTTEYHVKPSGSDYNAGTSSEPFRTIKKGVSRLKAGDILYVHTGTYVERVFVGESGTENAPITIMAYPGDSPVIDGQESLPSSDWSALVQIEGSYVHFSGFEVKNSNINGIYKGGMGVVLHGHHNILSKMNVHHTWENGVLIKGDHCIVEDCIIWQAARSNSSNPGSVNWSSGLSAARSTADGITTNAVLRRNTVYNNWGEGLSTYEAEGTIIEDNIIYDNWSVNLYISDSHDVLAQRNIIYNTSNNIVGQRRPVTLGDEKSSVPRSANNTLINNFIYNADLWAFWSTVVPGSGLDNVLIANNTIVDGQIIIGNNPFDGVINKSALICNNIFINENGSPWNTKGSLSNLTFSNNLWSAPTVNSLSSDGDIIGDPMLAKTGNTDPGELTVDYCRLLVTSPAINKGILLDNITFDIIGTPRDSTPDIGAFEYDFVPPLPVIDPGLLVTNDQTITVDVLFDEKVTGLDLQDFNIINGNASNLITNQTGKEYSVDITAADNGNVVIEIEAGAVLDMNNNSNIAASATYAYYKSESSIIFRYNDKIIICPTVVEDIIYIDNKLNAGVMIINLAGKIVYNKMNISDNLINISYLPKGFYLIRIETSEDVTVQKIIKK